MSKESMGKLRMTAAVSVAQARTLEACSDLVALARHLVSGYSVDQQAIHAGSALRALESALEIVRGLRDSLEEEGRR